MQGSFAKILLKKYFYEKIILKYKLHVQPVIKYPKNYFDMHQELFLTFRSLSHKEYIERYFYCLTSKYHGNFKSKKSIFLLKFF